MSNIEEAITESVEDAQMEETEEQTAEPEAPPAEATPSDSVEVTPAQATAEPAEQAPASVATSQDDFEKQYGIPAVAQSGRENRIPYSRVKKIVEKAVRDRAKELEDSFNPKISDYDTKVKDYESRLDKVAQFEQMMAQQPDEFMRRLATLPNYQPFFQAVEAAFKVMEANPALAQAAGLPAPQRTGTTPAASTNEPMPQPNRQLPDGSRVYDMEGLQKLMEWHGKQVETRVTSQVEARYKPLETDWQTQRRMSEAHTAVQAQIEEARKWPLFSESEADIVKALQANPQISLEGAYRTVVFPKLQAERSKMREEVLKEVKAAPRATAVTSRGSASSVNQAPSGPKSLEDVIREQVREFKDSV